MVKKCRLFKPAFKTYHTFEKGKKRLWGKIIDQKDNEVIIFNKKNPKGYKIYKEKCNDVVKWIDDGIIF